MKSIRFLVAFMVCGIALLLPFRARTAYQRLIAAIAHLPFILFGRLARFLLGSLDSGQEPVRPA